MLVIMFIVVLGLVVFSSGGEDEGQEAGGSSPTPITLTPNLTRTQTPIAGASSPTPLPTLGSVAVQPTQFRFPTSAPPPTLGSNPQPQPNPGSQVQTAIGITYPLPNTAINGNISVFGSASHPNFVQYALEYGPDPNPSNLWYPITSVPINRTVINSALGAWNTRAVPDGRYQVRLHIWLSGGVEDFRTVSGLQVANAAPTPQTANRNPQIAPIGAISLTKGKSVTLALSMSDPDFDALTYVAQSSNASLVTITPSGNSAITINGLNTGTANVTVGISDGRGGTASTSFSVNVTAPVATNNPPAIAPLPALSLNTGQNIAVNITASDPENDAITLGVTTSANGIVNASLTGKTLNISATAQGSVSVNITATDSKGLASTASFLVTVTNPAPANNPPVITAISNQTVEAGKTLDVSMAISDPNSDPLTINATSNNNGIVSAVVVNNTTLRLVGVAGGSGAITLTASDGKGGSATSSFNVTVSPPPAANNLPQITAVSNQTVDVGASSNVSVTTSDADGDSVSLSAAVNPAGVANVSASGNTLTISGATAGNTTVTITASDGKGSSTSTFSVQVNAVVAANNAPSVAPISDINCIVGEAPVVNFDYSDPDGDPVTPIAPPTSDNGGVASVVLGGAKVLNLNCISAGAALITIAVEDDKGLTGSDAFIVNVAPPANDPPALDPIAAVNCLVGEFPNVNFTYSDPNGDAVSAISAVSDNPGAASANLLDNNNASLSCLAPGSANVTITVQDANGESATGSFAVNVAAPVNNAPTVNGIGGQSCTAGQTINVPVSYSDPDGDPIISTNVASDNTGVADVFFADPTTLSVICNGAGNATITLTVGDDKGDSASQSFALSVAAPVNNPPAFDPLNNVTCDAGGSTTANFTYSDPDGNTVTPLSAASDNPGVANATLLDANNVGIDCISGGSANITITLQDGPGDVTTGSFSVTVNTAPPPPPFDVTVYSELPSGGTMTNVINNTFGGWAGNTTNKPIFSVAGDQSVLDQFLVGFNDPLNYNLGNNTDLDPLIQTYNGLGVFTAPRYAAGNGWTVETMFNPAASSPDCGGVAPFQCQLNNSNPSVIIIGFSPSNATSVSKDVFQANLQTAVSTSIANGTIPVLVTLPDDGSVDPALLADYNQVIATIADNSQVPLWNLYNTMDPLAQSDVYAVGNGNPYDLSDSALNSGVNRRNLQALRLLQTILNAIP
jgi:hypothetical protein